MICSYLIFPFPIVIIHIFFCLEKKVDLFFFGRRSVCKSAGTQLFYEITASALIATSLLLLQATESRHRKTTRCGRLCAERPLRAHRPPLRPSLWEGTVARRARPRCADLSGIGSPLEGAWGGWWPGRDTPWPQWGKGGSVRFFTEPRRTQCVLTILSVFVNL